MTVPGMRIGYVCIVLIVLGMLVSDTGRMAEAEELTQNDGDQPVQGHTERPSESLAAISEQIIEAVRNARKANQMQRVLVSGVDNFTGQNPVAINRLIVGEDSKYFINRLYVTNPDYYRILEVGAPEPVDSP